MWTRNRLNLQTPGSQPVMMLKNLHDHCSVVYSHIGENRQLVTAEPVEFEKQPFQTLYSR